MVKRTTRNLLKAVVGLVILVVVAITAGKAGWTTLSSILNPDHTTRLQRYSTGRDQVVVEIKGVGIRLAFPSEPKASGEIAHLGFFGRVSAQRRISAVGDDAAELVWYRVPAALAGGPQLVETLGGLAAQDVGGKAHDIQTLADSVPPAYQFRVPARPHQKGDYYVRVMIDRGIAFVFRVRASVGGINALNYFASSYCVLGRTCKNLGTHSSTTSTTSARKTHS